MNIGNSDLHTGQASIARGLLHRQGMHGRVVLLFAVCFLTISLINVAHCQTDVNWERWMSGQVKAVNVLVSVTPLELGVLKQNWKINAIRAQVILDDKTLRELANDGFVSNKNIYWQIRTLLNTAEGKGLGVILDLHRPEGGQEGSNGRLWQDQLLQDRLVSLWAHLSSAFKDHPALIAYDILNEPTPPDDWHKSFNQIRGTLQDWNVLAKRIVSAIRVIDKNIPLILETTDYAKSFRFRQLEKLDDHRIIYSFHMYSPFELTHQGINQFKKNTALTYPGSINGKYIDRTDLVRTMQDAKLFADKHRTPVFVGEFGINKYAPAESRHRYIKDLLDIFEDEGWSWSYHAFQIWDGWMPNERMLGEIISHATK